MTLDAIDLPDGALHFDPAFLDAPTADHYLARLRATLALAAHSVVLYGRRVVSPRLSCWYGDPEARYRYSGLSLEPRPWTAELGALRERVSGAAGVAFNSVLCNLYRDGGDSMGWHSDDERELGREPVIASLSLGATRRFVLRHKKKAAPARELELTHGSLLVMRGATQHHWKHAIPRTARPVGPRLNLTFRVIVAPVA